MLSANAIQSTMAKLDELDENEGCENNGLFQQKHSVTWLYVFENMFVKSNIPHF